MVAYPFSNDFVKALKSPVKEQYIKLEFYRVDGTYISEFTRQVSKDDIGTISVDANRPVKRAFSFTLDNSKNEFDWGEDKLIWIDKRVKLYIGLRLFNGTIEYIPQGVYILSAPEQIHTLDSGKMVILQGQDKMWLMTDNRGKFIYDTTLEVGLNIGQALKIIAGKAGETLFNFDEITETIPYTMTYQAGDNLYKALEELALKAKGTIGYDVNGYLRFKKIDLNEFDNEPIQWSYVKGDTFYAGSSRKMDESILSNDVFVYGGAASTAVARYRITIDENDPLWDGNPYSIQKIGRLTYWHNNGNPDSLLLTDEECKWRCKYEIMRRLGYDERLSLQISPNYLHDYNDVIEVIDEENGVTGKYLIESMSIPINPQIMSLECKKMRRVINDWSFI